MDNKRFTSRQHHLFRFGWESGDEVGADGRVATGRLDPLDRAHGFGAAVAPSHSLEDQIVPGLER